MHRTLILKAPDCRSGIDDVGRALFLRIRITIRCGIELGDIDIRRAVIFSRVVIASVGRRRIETGRTSDERAARKNEEGKPARDGHEPCSR
jgi:hypothetical protein